MLPILSSPHIVSLKRKARAMQYNLFNGVTELLDFVFADIRVCILQKKPLTINNINIDFVLSEGKIYEFTYSDNYKEGFKGLCEQGQQNPMSIGYIREGQEDDNDLSEFGGGIKDTAMAMGTKFEVLTKTNEEYIKVNYDFIKMALHKDPIASIQPTEFRKESEEYYNSHHPYPTGSSLKISEIYPDFHSHTDEETMKNLLIDHVIKTYNPILKLAGDNLNFQINGYKVEYKPNYFEMTQTQPFTITCHLYEYKDQYNNPIFYIEFKDPNKKKQSTMKYNKNQDTWEYLNKSEVKKLIKLETMYDTGFMLEKRGLMAILRVTSTFAVPNIEKNLPKGDVDVIRVDRCLASININPRRTNGGHNFTAAEMKFISKPFGKKAGTTSKKGFEFNNNDSGNAIKSLLNKKLFCSLSMNSEKQTQHMVKKAEKCGILIPERYKKFRSAKVPEAMKKDIPQKKNKKKGKLVLVSKEKLENFSEKASVKANSETDSEAETNSEVDSDIEDKDEDETNSEVVPESDTEVVSEADKDKNDDDCVTEEEEEDYDDDDGMCKDEVSAQDENHDEPIVSIDDIPPAKTRNLSGGKQTRMDKKSIMVALEWIPKKIEVLNNENTDKGKEAYKTACILLYHMMLEGINRSAPKNEPLHLEMAEALGYEYWHKKYLHLVQYKLDEDDCVGGSLLSKFISLYS